MLIKFHSNTVLHFSHSKFFSLWVALLVGECKFAVDNDNKKTIAVDLQY